MPKVKRRVIRCDLMTEAQAAAATPHGWFEAAHITLTYDGFPGGRYFMVQPDAPECDGAGELEELRAAVRAYHAAMDDASIVAKNGIRHAMFALVPDEPEPEPSLLEASVAFRDVQARFYANNDVGSDSNALERAEAEWQAAIAREEASDGNRENG